MYLRAKYTKYKMAKTKFSIWRYVICEICKKNGSNRPFLASRVADTIFPPPIEGHHRQLDNQCKDPMDKTKDCRVGQLTRCHPAGVWGTLVGTGHGQSGGCVRKTSTKSFSFCYVFGSFGGFSSGQLYISSTFQVLFGSQV